MNVLSGEKITARAALSNNTNGPPAIPPFIFVSFPPHLSKKYSFIVNYDIIISSTILLFVFVSIPFINKCKNYFCILQ